MLSLPFLLQVSHSPGSSLVSGKIYFQTRPLGAKGKEKMRAAVEPGTKYDFSSLNQNKTGEGGGSQGCLSRVSGISPRHNGSHSVFLSRTSKHLEFICVIFMLKILLAPTRMSLDMLVRNLTIRIPKYLLEVFQKFLGII